MRSPLASLIALVALTGCSSGVTVVRQPPAPRPVPVVVLEPLEIDIARPHNGKLFVQTNRAAYVAIFEIVPERGVELVYPVSARQRRFVVAGLRDVPVWWEPSRVTRHAGWSASRSEPRRYIYALASDEPLRIPDAAFQTGYLHGVLGTRARASNPYATMRALAREFLPRVAEEEWAEDAYALSPSYATERYRVTRVYCRNGTMYEVPSELANRVWCPSSPPATTGGPGRVTEVDLPGSRRPLVRPDSVVGDNGRRVATRAHGAPGRGPIDRVKEPAGMDDRGNGRDENDDRPGNGRTKDRPEQRSDERPVVPNDRAGDPPPRGRGAEMSEANPVREHPVSMSERGRKQEPVAEPNAGSGAEEKPRPAKEKAAAPSEKAGPPGAKAGPHGETADPASEKPGTPAEKAQPADEKPSEKDGQPKKERGKSNPSNEKPNGKSKDAAEPKPLS